MGKGLLVIEASRSHSETPQSVGILWTGDQTVAETSTWQNTTPTTDIHKTPLDGWAARRRNLFLTTHNPSVATAGFEPIIPTSEGPHTDVLGLIHSASRSEPNRADSAWKRNLRYEMEAFTLHAEPSRTESDRAWPSVFPGWCLFLLAGPPGSAAYLSRNRRENFSLNAGRTIWRETWREAVLEVLAGEKLWLVSHVHSTRPLLSARVIIYSDKVTRTVNEDIMLWGSTW